MKVRNVNESLQQKLNVPSEAMLEKVEALIEENKKLKKTGAARQLSLLKSFYQNLMRLMIGFCMLSRLLLKTISF